MNASSPAMGRLPRAAAGTLDDAALVRATQAGKKDAVLLVWDRYASLVRGVLRRSLGPRPDVEDLVQDVFLGFYRNIDNLRDPDALRGFLVSIATKTAISHIRKSKVRSFLRLTDDGELPDLVGSTDDGPEALGRLYALLDTCSATDRMAFVLRYIEGMELEEVATALDVSLSTAKRLIAKVNARIVAMARQDVLLSAYVMEENEEGSS
jgi:RNA polymerase sigma-70 factor (ECF subfamily)